MSRILEVLSEYDEQLIEDVNITIGSRNKDTYQYETKEIEIN
jgi:hypothetical protein